MSIPIPLDRSGTSTLQEQIYEYIRRQILSGALPVGARLCSTRDLADFLKVSRNTAVLAYQWLASEGYVATQAGAGTFVCATETAPSPLLPSGESGTADGRSLAARRYPEILIPYELPEPFGRVFNRPVVDLWYGRVDPRQFPIKIWRRILAEHLLTIPKRLSEYSPPSGIPELREAIAQHLVAAKGIVADPDQIIITCGAQDGMAMIARLFVTRGVSVAIESPGYASAAALFQSFGASLIPLSVDEEGVTTHGIADGPSLIYTTPSHQFPTGVIMSPARRFELLAAAEQAGAYVIEDDYDGEIIYDRPPVAALAALDRGDRVIYVGSFSKSLGAGLRLGFLVVPKSLAGPVAAVKSITSYGQPWLEQRVLATYIASGSFAAHLRRIRLLFRERRDAAITALHACFGSVAISGQEAGLHLICSLPPDGPSPDQVVAVGRDIGIGLYTPAQAGTFEVASKANNHELLIGYANLTPAEIAAAFSRLGTALTRHGARAA